MILPMKQALLPGHDFTNKRKEPISGQDPPDFFGSMGKPSASAINLCLSERPETKWPFIRQNLLSWGPNGMKSPKGRITLPCNGDQGKLFTIF